MTENVKTRTSRGHMALKVHINYLRFFLQGQTGEVKCLIKISPNLKPNIQPLEVQIPGIHLQTGPILINSHYRDFRAVPNQEYMNGRLEITVQIDSTLFSSTPPSSLTSPSKGYSRRITGGSGVIALTKKPKVMKPATAIRNWRRASLIGIGDGSGPHMDKTSSCS